MVQINPPWKGLPIELKSNSESGPPYTNIVHLHGNQAPYTPIEAEEFKQMLKDRPKVKKDYEDFLTNEAQALRSRINGGLFWDDKLDTLFEIASISGIRPSDKPTKSLAEQRAWQKKLRQIKMGGH
jgi:hypothetical protein